MEAIQEIQTKLCSMVEIRNKDFEKVNEIISDIVAEKYGTLSSVERDHLTNRMLEIQQLVQKIQMELLNESILQAAMNLLVAKDEE